MDEMQLIQELGEQTPMATRDRLAGARDRLAVAMAEPPAPDVRTARPARRRIGWRLRWSGFATAGLAAIAGAVYVLAPDQVGGEVPAANAEAVQVLHQAAAAALRVPDVEPRPDQFVYLKKQSGAGIRQDWRSVDGTRDGLAIEQRGGRTERMTFPGCRDGRRATVKGNRVDPIQTEPCTPEPGYIRDLPTDPDAVLGYLKARTNPGDINDLGKYISYLAGQSYLRSSARAALFDAAAEIPGLTVVKNATDGGGRTGIGIAWSSNGISRVSIIFDPATHVFLGSPEEAVLAVDIVDTAGPAN